MKFFKIGGIDNPSPLVKSIEKYSTLSVIRLAGAADFNTIPPVERAIEDHQEFLDQDIVIWSENTLKSENWNQLYASTIR
ncbi:MAG: hypothetical protein PHT32_03020 [Candidatus Omnitrophica bacterium]|nr:hypothetical protein [Candidatus Omnitrophota bacterium]